MKRITIEYPDDCPVADAIAYAKGCFNQTQNDYMSLQNGYGYGRGLCFGDGRYGYFYKTNIGNYVLKLQQKERDGK